MITAVREWLTVIIIVTLLVSVAQMLIPEGTIRKSASFIGGLILLAAMLQPLQKIKIGDMELDFGSYEKTVEARRQELEMEGVFQLAEEVEARVAACIERRAAEFGLDVEAYVKTITGEDAIPVPSVVEIDCSYDERLAVWIETEIGIPKEHQNWSAQR